MRFQHYNAAVRRGTGNARTVDVQALYVRGRRGEPRLGLDGRFRLGPYLSLSRGLAFARTSS